MRSAIVHNPSFGVLRVTFDRPGEQLLARARAFLSQDVDVEARTTLPASPAPQGPGSPDARGRAELPTTTFTATAPGQSVWLAPPADGAVTSVAIAAGAELFVAGDAWMATTSGLSLDLAWAGARKVFEHGGTLARAWGEGEIWLGAFGGVHEVDVGGATSAYFCDTAHLLAFTQGLRHEVQDAPGLRGQAGAGRAVILSGQGRVWLQTRKPAALAAFCHPFRGVGGAKPD